MEDKNKFLNKMENLQVPGIGPQAHQPRVKMTVMNANRSAAVGLWLIIVPCCFLFCACIYYYFHPHANWFSSVFDLLMGLEKVPLADYLLPVLLILMPIICIVINILATTHIAIRKAGADKIKTNELNISIKLKLWNILLILISLIILFAFLTFVSTQNIAVRN